VEATAAAGGKVTTLCAGSYPTSFCGRALCARSLRVELPTPSLHSAYEANN
jgi:hypothetical protein